MINDPKTRRKETIRKSVHGIFGILIAAFIYLSPPFFSIPALAVGLIGGALIADAIAVGIPVPLFSQMVTMLERKQTVPGKGAFFFVLASLCCLIIFGPLIAAASVLVLAVLDAISALIGIRWGRHPVYRGRTAEGTISGIIAGTLALGLLLPPEISIIGGIIAGVTELFSPVDDNLTIPLVTSIVLFILLQF